MTRPRTRDLLSLAFLVVLCSYLFFFRLGSLALTDPDETFYAQTAKEMVQKGEWVTPHLYGKPQFEKPILFYSLVEVSYKLFGVNEFAARLPSAVFGVIGVIAIYLLGSLLFSPRAGFLSALTLATGVEYIILSRACITDMVLATFMLLGALFFLLGYIKGKGHWYVLSAAAIALATLAKGPIALLLFGAAVIIFLFLARDLKALLRMPLWQAALVYVAIAAPWYAYVYQLHGNAFLDAFFGFHNITRFLEAEHKIGSQVYYNIPIVFGGFFPWSVFLPVGFWHIWKKATSHKPLATGYEKNGSTFILVWFVVIFGFFTVSSTKLPTYIFPCFISLAMIVGVLLDDFLKEGAPRGLTKGVSVSYYLLAAVVFLGWIGAAIYAKIDFPSILTGVVVSSLFLAFGMALSLVAFRRRAFLASFMLIPYAVAVFLYSMNVLVVPEIERYETSKEAALKIASLMKPDERLGAGSNYLPGLAFYTGTFPIDLDRHHDQIMFMNSPERIWAVMKAKNHEALYDPTITTTYVKPSYVVYSIGKRDVITNEVPPDGRFIKKRESTF